MDGSAAHCPTCRARFGPVIPGTCTGSVDAPHRRARTVPGPPPPRDPESVGCEHCGARPWQSCMTHPGQQSQRRVRPHRARILAAR